MNRLESARGVASARLRVDKGNLTPRANQPVAPNNGGYGEPQTCHNQVNLRTLGHDSYERLGELGSSGLQTSTRHVSMRSVSLNTERHMHDSDNLNDRST